MARRRAWVALVVGAAALAAGAWLAWAAYLGLFAGEGALPPRWRAPAVPADARVVRETTECGSGGCWRQLLLRPTGATSAVALAAEMGVTAEHRQGWRLLDPHGVSVGSRVVDGDLQVHVGY
jgi:hypothetical protein